MTAVNWFWTDSDEQELRHLWERHGGRIVTIAKIMGRTKGSISGKSRNLSLQFHGGVARKLKPSEPAATQARSVFSSRVIAPVIGILKDGNNQRKLGSRVTKGAWKDMPIYSLTLEERATCPHDCALWLNCYGNNMGRAKRYKHGPELERTLAADLSALAMKHRGGFVIRLHILGDFYATRYVDFWASMMERYPGMRVFGYTARQSHDVIGERVAALRDFAWDRFAIRTSGAPDGPRTLVVKDAKAAPRDAIICPVQIGRSRNCGTCGLCWSPAAKDRPIAFLEH